MRKLFLFWLCFWGVCLWSQENKNVTTLTKDPYFTPSKAQKTTTLNEEDKIRHIHSDSLVSKPTLYNGNPVFIGNVEFQHKGSVLKADKVIFYQNDNFVKAIGNVELTTSDGNRITSQEMEYDGKTERGIARKNVVLTDPQQTIKTETLYYDKLPNTAYFNSGGTIYNGKNTIWTQSATYNINTQTVDVSGNVNIDSDQYRVEGSKIIQNQRTNVAEFFGATRVINKNNPRNYVYTEKGRYLMNSKEVYLNKNSRIHYNGKILTGDTMYYNQNTGFGTAKGNAYLDDPKENRYIKGGYAEIYEFKDSAMITEKPYAVKILKNDSIYFSAQKILAFQKPDSTQTKKSYLRAFHQARVFKQDMHGRADSLSFNETDGVMHMVGSPIFWSGQKQISGDKIEVYMNMQTEQVDSIKVIGNAFAISKADSLNMKDEFNQVKGNLMTVFFVNEEIKLAKVIGNAQAITYADSQDEKTKTVDRIGIAFSTCGVIEALFEEQKVQIISCNIGSNTDIYPMSMVSKDKRFFPDFNWNTRDRLKTWRDIFLDTPNYPETQYTSDDSLYEKAKALKQKAEAEKQKNEPKRKRKK
ncbi:OstA-like protein [Riemerella columbina]|uniref:OstA-like protein n=1 Tax=Riemerella columbina TaxID=103810 RepID=UPI000380932C|nr:OstA-like protein [Riemerella columbina]